MGKLRKTWKKNIKHEERQVMEGKMRVVEMQRIFKHIILLACMNIHILLQIKFSFSFLQHENIKIGVCVVNVSVCMSTEHICVEIYGSL